MKLHRPLVSMCGIMNLKDRFIKQKNKITAVDEYLKILNNLRFSPNFNICIKVLESR